MAMFRRRAKNGLGDSADPAAEVEATDESLEVEVAELPDVTVPAFDRSAGPFDDSEADAADADLPRIDLGALRIPGIASLGVQVEADQSTGEIHAVTVIGEEAAVQLQPFAAPRTEGIWDEVRAEMLADLSSSADARVAEAEGAFGPELRAIVPAQTPEGQEIRQPIRFAGIDGPRWFLRVMFLGKAAVEPDPDDDLHRMIRQTIVVRGGEAMAPRDPLPLRLPEAPPTGMEALGEDGEVVEGAPTEAEDADAEGAGSKYDGIDPFERGPEITEVR